MAQGLGRQWRVDARRETTYTKFSQPPPLAFIQPAGSPSLRAEGTEPKALGLPKPQAQSLGVRDNSRKSVKRALDPSAGGLAIHVIRTHRVYSKPGINVKPSIFS